MEKSKVKEKIEGLIEKYENVENRKILNEANVRKDFIDPLFEALGWNVRDSHEYDAEMYIRGAGYADITLKIDNKPVVFVEAKRFGVVPSREDLTHQTTLEGHKLPVDWTEEERQVLNYAGRTVGVKWAILTNFEKFRLFNAYTGEIVLNTEKPKEYLERIDDLMLLTEDSLRSGDIEVLEDRIERPDIDENFLNLMNYCRFLLAEEIHDKFPEMDFDKLKFYTQRILDRMIIIRYAEDKWILDQPDQLKKAVDFYKGTEYTQLSSNLINFFDGFDNVHNTKIFEKDEELDKILKKVDDEILSEIIEHLYRQNFRKFKSDILGNTYEAYLSTKFEKKDDKIKIQTVDEARKEAGIYYTPTHVVEYILENTLTPKLEKIWKETQKLLKKEEYPQAVKKFKETEKIKILDPACGSGSFLVKAYELFEEHYKKYKKEIQKIREKTKKENQGQAKITETNILTKLEEPLKNYRWKILKKNIYGVDLDKVAAEIASINLMLKAMKRGEKLPLILEENIKVGNSIVTGVEGREELEEHSKEIETMIKYREKIKTEKDPKKKTKLEKKYKKLKEKIEDEINENLQEHFKKPEKQKPFNYELEFPEVFYTREGKLKQNPGFDIIIGNPPYIRQEKIKHLKPYLKSQYETYTGTADLYIYFIERGLKLLKKGGTFSHITSNKYTRAKYGQPLRKWILENFKIEKYYDYTGEKVFKDATVDPSTIIIKKTPPEGSITVNEDFKLPQKYLTEEIWTFQKPEIYQIKEKIEKIGKPLKEWPIKIYFGIKTGFNEAFIINDKKRREILENCGSREERERTEQIIKPILRGRDIKRYSYDWKGLWIIGTFPALKLEIDDYPNLKEYLKSFGERLKQDGKPGHRKKTNNKWFETQDTIAYYHEFEREKIVWQEIVRSPSFAYDDNNIYIEATAFLMTGERLKYILGLLNSRPVSFFFKTYYAGGGLGEGYRYKKAFLERLPIPPITKENKDTVKEIEELVDQILELNRKKQFIQKTFKTLVENTRQGRTPLGEYLEPKNAPDYNINLARMKKLVDDDKEVVPRRYRVHGGEDYLVLGVAYDGKVEDVLKVYFDDQTIKEFFHLSIHDDVAGKKRMYRSKKKILNTILTDIRVPRSTRNKSKDLENMKALMKILNREYEKEFNDPRPSLAELEEKIQEVDARIDELVYELYGLDDREKRIVEESLNS